MELSNGKTPKFGSSFAMAQHQLGNKVEARTWYNKAVAWMVKNAGKDEDFGRVRAEAEVLLGISAVDPK